MNRRDGKDWSDDKVLRDFVRSQDPDLRTLTRKSINHQGAIVLDSSGKVLHQAESNTQLLQMLQKWIITNPISKSSIRKGFLVSTLNFESIENRVLKMEAELKFVTSGRANTLYSESERRRKIRDIETEIQELKGEI